MKIRSFLLILIALTLSCSGKPQLTITPEIYETGDMAPREKRTKWIVLSNPGAKTLIVENVRPLCDCITVESIPDSIIAGATDSFKIVYVAADSPGMDEKSLMVRTNAKPENRKITVKSNVLRVKLTAEDSSIAIIPFQVNGIQDGQNFSIRMFEYIVQNLPKGYKPVNPNEITLKIQSDPNYAIEPLFEVARKWNNLLGIRYTIIGDIRPSETGSGLDISFILVDGFFQLPLGKRILGVSREKAYSATADTIKATFDNIVELRKQTLFADIQRKWAEQRAKLVGKPAPPLYAEDVRTGKRSSIEDFRGKPLIIQFFSTDCKHCEEEMDWLTKLVTAHPKIGALGVSVNVGQIDSVRAFIKGKTLPYPVILPNKEEDKLLDPYYGGATPQTVIITPNGIVFEWMMGSSDKALQAFERILIDMSENPQNYRSGNR